MEKYNASVLQHLKWEQNKAPNLTSLVEKKAEWLAEYNEGFWENWYTNVFNIDTANSFGLSLWCIILGVSSDLFDFTPATQRWAFGRFRENFIYDPNYHTTNPLPTNKQSKGGNFGSEGDALSNLDDVRTLLKFRYATLVSSGRIAYMNRMMNMILNKGKPWDVANHEYAYAVDSTSKGVPLAATVWISDWQGMRDIPTGAASSRREYIIGNTDLNGAQFVKNEVSVLSRTITAPDGTSAANIIAPTVTDGVHTFEIDTSYGGNAFKNPSFEEELLYWTVGKPAKTSVEFGGYVGDKCCRIANDTTAVSIVQQDSLVAGKVYVASVMVRFSSDAVVADSSNTKIRIAPSGQPPLMDIQFVGGGIPIYTDWKLITGQFTASVTGPYDISIVGLLSAGYLEVDDVKLYEKVGTVVNNDYPTEVNDIVFSSFIKGDRYTKIGIETHHFGPNGQHTVAGYNTVDLATGDIGGGGDTRIISYPNDWFRIFIRTDVPDEFVTSRFVIYMLDDNGNQSFGGDPYGGISIWGMMAEISEDENDFVSVQNFPESFIGANNVTTAGVISFGRVPNAGMEIYWSGSWGLGSYGNPQLVATANGTINSFQISKPVNDGALVTAANKIEFRIGKNVKISDKLINLMNDRSNGLMFQNACVTYQVIKES